MDLGIKGRAAIVTGASRGIGRETARQFLEEGVRVMICGRRFVQPRAAALLVDREVVGIRVGASRLLVELHQ